MATIVTTKRYKNSFGLYVVKSTTMISDKLELVLTTSKRHSGSLISTGIVGHVNDAIITHMLLTDFNKVCKSTTHKRITSKIVDAQHDSIDMDTVIADAKAFYKLT